MWSVTDPISPLVDQFMIHQIHQWISGSLPWSTDHDEKCSRMRTIRSSRHACNTSVQPSTFKLFQQTQGGHWSSHRRPSKHILSIIWPKAIRCYSSKNLAKRLRNVFWYRKQSTAPPSESLVPVGDWENISPKHCQDSCDLCNGFKYCRGWLYSASLIATKTWVAVPPFSTTLRSSLTAFLHWDASYQNWGARGLELGRISQEQDPTLRYFVAHVGRGWWGSYFQRLCRRHRSEKGWLEEDRVLQKTSIDI